MPTPQIANFDFLPPCDPFSLSCDSLKSVKSLSASGIADLRTSLVRDLTLDFCQLKLAASRSYDQRISQQKQNPCQSSNP